MANSGLIQGMDTIPTQVVEKYGEFIAEYLPGWSASGTYQFQPGAYTQMAAAQMGFLEHRGSHPWINKRLMALFEKLKTGRDAGLLTEKQVTEDCAVVVNFMSRAFSPKNLADGGAQTGGYIAFASKEDPRALQKFGTKLLESL